MKVIVVLVLAGNIAVAGAEPLEKEPAVQAMKDELARTMAKLELPGAPKPYFVSYDYWDQRSYFVNASFGALESSGETPRRFIDIDVRVGDKTFDNSNLANDFGSRSSVGISIDDDYASIRRDLWLTTDGAYKEAIESLERKQAVAKAETKSDEDIGSFSTEPPSHLVDLPPAKPYDLAKMAALAKKLSAVFRQYPDIYTGSAGLSATVGRRIYMSSEGSLSAQPEGGVQLLITCDTQAPDGMKLHDARHYYGHSFDELPSEAVLLAETEKMAKQLTALRSAPVVDDYAGPVLFTDVAAGEVVRALLAENFSGTLAPKGDRPGAAAYGESELVGKVGQRILPAGVDVVDDPSLQTVAKQPVLGGYKFDEEGVPGTKVSLVEKGTFKRFLMSRAPRKGFEHSTGHGRSTKMVPVRAHPSNLVLSSNARVADRDMVKRALKEAKTAGLKYVLVVDHLAASIGPGDFDFDAFSSGASLVPRPNAIKRVYLDGHEEIVRGGTFAGVQLRNLKDIVAVGTTPTAYNYAASGLGARFDLFAGNTAGFTVSISAPPLLFHDLDVKKPKGPQKKPPVAPRPPLPSKERDK